MGHGAKLQDAGVVHQDVDLAEARFGLGDHLVPSGFFAHVVVAVDDRIADVSRDGLAEVVEHIAEHDLGPLGREQAHLGFALAPCSAADDGNFA